MNPWTLIFSTFVAFTSGFRIVCYYTNAPQNSAGLRVLKSMNMDPFLCTHLVYSHARISGLNLAPTHQNDEPTLLKPGMIRQVVNLKVSNPQLKVLLAVGNLTESLEAFFAVANSESNRATFAKNLAMYVRVRNFDGAQMEWGSLATTRNPRYDKTKFLLLLKAIRKAFTEDSTQQKAKLILAVTMPAVKKHLDSGYKVRELVMEADFISIRTFDMRTGDNDQVGLTAPLRSDPTAVGDDRYLSVEWVTKYFLSLEVPKDKITIGIPTFGRSFKLKSELMNKIGAASISQDNPAPLTATGDIVSYSEVCRLLWAGGSVEHVTSQGGRYYTLGTQWISYEDILSVSQKTCFIRKHGLGGITFWTLDLDDFTGESCLHGKYPLISTAVNLMTYSDPHICTETNLTKYVDVPLSATEDASPHSTPHEDKSRIVCYYTNWAQYRHGKGRFLPENISAHLCTHIVYGYAVVQDLEIAPFIENDESMPWIEGMYGRVIRAKKLNPHLKILLGVGGGSAGYASLGDLLVDTSMFETFAKCVAIFLQEHDFDGLELTWQQPLARWKDNFSFLIKILRTVFNDYAAFHRPPPFLLTLAMPAGKVNIDSGYSSEMHWIAANVDFLSLMTYDFHGSWDVNTGHNSPLFPDPSDRDNDGYLNVDWVVKYYLSLGVPPRSMTIGIATYGRSFTLRDATHHNLKSPAEGPGKPGRFTGKPGLLAYYEVCDFIAGGANVSYIPSQRVSYAFKDTQWVGYDDVTSVIDKACYAVYQGFGGVNVMTLDFDDFTGDSCNQGQYPLLTRIYKIVRRIDNQTCSNFTPGQGCGGFPSYFIF